MSFYPSTKQKALLNRVGKKLLTLKMEFHKTKERYISSSMRYDLEDLIMSIYRYLLINEFKEAFEEASEDPNTGSLYKDKETHLAELETEMREMIIDGISQLDRDYPFSEQSQFISFALEREEPLPDTENDEMRFNYKPPKEDKFCLRINIPKKKTPVKDKGGIGYERPFGLESSEFFDKAMLMDFATFLFCVANSNIFIKNMLNGKNDRNITIWNKYQKLIFGDIN